MKNLTIRGIDPALDQALKSTAKKKSSSVNQLVLEMLKQHCGLSKPPHYSRRHHDLDDLFGRWDEEDYARIQAATAGQRRIDPELWS
ncbi:MAG: hypothetical protein KGZ60_04070 [Truepera sp.]|nr:hypothetical protein [Truepera sp.]